MKEIINITQKQPTKWEKILTNNISGMRLIFKTYAELIQLNELQNLLKNGQSLSIHFPVKTINRHMKKCSVSLITKRKIRPMRHHLVTVRMAIKQKMANNKLHEGERTFQILSEGIGKGGSDMGEKRHKLPVTKLMSHRGEMGSRWEEYSQLY